MYAQPAAAVPGEPGAFEQGDAAWRQRVLAGLPGVDLQQQIGVAQPDRYATSGVFEHQAGVPTVPRHHRTPAPSLALPFAGPGLHIDVPPDTWAAADASWSGTLAVTTSGVTDHDVAFVPPGGSADVSTLVAGSPRPAGIIATLDRSGADPNAEVARLSVATYDGPPPESPGNPYAPADPYSPTDPYRVGYIDLQLTNADDGDVIVGAFYAEDSVYPPDAVFPSNPLIPTDPLLPGDPYRLAYWLNDAWVPIYSANGSLPGYDTDVHTFAVTFDTTSTPKVTELDGTVFALIPSFYFRGFGIPVDAGIVNVAKAGRAIPLKWQMFNATAEPVLALDPAIVKISSVMIPCEASNEPTDTLEEYATGKSGLHNLGGGNYQVNWATSKGYAGTCRQLRLDLGERNPDGTVFYRTADFRFTR